MSWSIHPDTCAQAARALNELLPLVERGERHRQVYAEEQSQPGYSIKAEEDRIHIGYHTLTDLARGVLDACSHTEDCFTLQRHCAFQEFGVMADLSRNAVMKPEAIRRLIRLSALMGYSFVGLYMEDTIQLDGEPYFGYQRGAMTKKELQELDRYAASLGVELRPYLQTLAHLNQIMRYQRYDAINDTGDILLAGDERTYHLLDRLLKTVSDCFTTRKVNIGMDEAALVGAGKYLDQNGYRPRIEILQEHLARVLGLCEKYGLKAQMWSDMFFNLAYGSYDKAAEGASAQCQPEIPPQVELAFWDYFHVGQARYETMLQKHRQMAGRVAFAGGAWKWSGFTPSNAFSIEAGRDALNACIKEQVESAVITAWGDNGAEASMFSILPVLYADAALAWGQPGEREGFEILTGVRFSDFLELDRPSRFSPDPAVHGNASKFLLYNDPLLGTYDSLVPEDVEAFYAQAARELARVESIAGEYAGLFRTQKTLSMLLEKKAALGRNIKRAYDSGDREQLRQITEYEIPQLLERLDTFADALVEQWMAENKAFGFEVQDLRLGGLRRRVQQTEKRLRDYLNGATERIEELEGERLPFAYFDNSSIETLNYNLWAVNATPAVL